MNDYKTNSILFYRRTKKRIGRFWAKPLSNSFQRFAQFILIAMTIVTIGFAYQTVQLTRKYGENKDQLYKLEAILKVNQQEQKTRNHFDSISMRANKNIFSNLFYRIMDLQENFVKISGNQDLLPINQKIDYLTQMNTMVESQFTNPYLLEDDTLQKKWIHFGGNISTCIRILKINPGSVTIDGKKLSFEDGQAYEAQIKINWFNKTFNKQFDDFLGSTLIKLMRDKELMYQK
jgi:hypothetical protein